MNSDRSSTRLPSDRSSTRLPRVLCLQDELVELDPRDRSWENQLLILLCALETLRSRLHERCEAGLAVAALDTMLAMMDRLSLFIEHPDLEEEREALAGGIEWVRGEAGQLRNRLCRSPLQMLMRLFRSPSRDDPRVQFVESAQGLYDVLTRAFEFFLERFQSPHSAQDWNEAHRSFLADLGELIELLQP